MPALLWDASALVKRYTLEVGSDTVDFFFQEIPQSQMVTTSWSYAEVFAALWRKHNQGKISLQTFSAAVTLLQREVLDSSGFKLVSIDDTTVLSGLEYIQRANLNAFDAAVLVIGLRLAQEEIEGSFALVSADKRLNRAAQAERLIALNPEALSSEEARAFIARFLKG